MSLYGMENFAYGNVAATFTNSQTTLSMFTGHTSRFTIFPCMAVLFNITDHDQPHEAFFEPVTPDAEIIEIVSKSGDTFDVIKRGQDGTSAIATTSGKTYRVAVVATKSQWDKVCRAPPDGSDSFDAILAGTAGTVAEALARFVKDVAGEDAVVSAQGSDQAGDKTSLWLGDITTPNDVRLERLQAATRTLELIFNSLNILRVEDSGAIAFNKSTITDTAPSVEFGENVGFDKLAAYTESVMTLATDIGTGTSNVIRVAAQSGGVDDLVTLNATPYFGMRPIVILRRNSSDTVTVKSTGNISLLSGDYVINTSSKFIALIADQFPITSWHELFRT